LDVGFRGALAIICVSAVAAPIAPGAAPGAAPAVELTGVVTDGPSIADVSPRRIGDDRFMAVSSVLKLVGGRPHVDVLELESREVRRLPVSVEALADRPLGELVSFRPDRTGVLLQTLSSSRYVELDPDRGAPVRSVELGPYDIAGLRFIGTDPVTDIAWFGIIRDHPQRPELRQLVIRSVNLQTLSITDHVQVPMRRRTSSSGYEEWLELHPSADFSRFAAVEYAEDGLEMDEARLWVIDVEAFSWFSVKAPSTAYGAVFSGDNQFLYVVSNQRGSIERVRLTDERIDKTTFGLKAAHHLGIAPDSGRLYAMGSSVYYAGVEPPDLGGRRTGRHPLPVRQHMRYLLGGGAMSGDGRFFVVAGDYTESMSEPRKLFVLRLR
jgi:hypothetical protein